MEPEEIDRLFRDRLAGLPAEPATDGWMRLQQKMQAPKKNKNRGLYYAAASVLLLLALAWYGQQKPGANNPVVATNSAASSPEKPAGSTSEKIAQSPVPQASLESEVEASPEPEAALPQNALVQAPALPKAKAGKTPAPVKAPSQKQPARSQDLTLAPEQAIASRQARESQQAQAPATAPLVALQAAERSTPLPDLSVVEVVVKKDPEQQAPGYWRERLHQKGSKLRILYQQARNLKNGEPVELTALGINENKLREETKELKQKLTNVISL